jgi:hypothetical protein
MFRSVLFGVHEHFHLICARVLRADSLDSILEAQAACGPQESLVAAIMASGDKSAAELIVFVKLEGDPSFPEPLTNVRRCRCPTAGESTT